MTASTSHVASDRLLWEGRALLFAGIVVSAFTLRTAVTSLTPLFDELGTELSFGPTMVGVFGMVPTAAFALFGVLTPAIAHRIGLERSSLVAMGLAASGLLARAFATGTPQLLVASAIALAGMGMGNVVLPPLVKRYFPDRVGTVSSTYIAMLQLGTILPALCAVPLSRSFGWRFSLGSWSVFAAIAALVWLVAIVMEDEGTSDVARSLADVRDRAVEPGDEAPEIATSSRGRVSRAPLAWGMALMFGMTSLITYSMFTWLPTLLVESGAGAEVGGNMVALFSALGLVSALGMPALAVRVANPFPVILVCGVMFLVGFAGLAFAPTTAPVLWVCCLGLGPSTFPLGLTLINLRTRTSEGSAALSGFMQGVGYSLSCLGPLGFGWLHERTHGWAWPFAFLTVALLVLVAAGRVVSAPTKLEDVW